MTATGTTVQEQNHLYEQFEIKMEQWPLAAGKLHQQYDRKQRQHQHWSRFPLISVFHNPTPLINPSLQQGQHQHRSGFPLIFVFRNPTLRPKLSAAAQADLCTRLGTSVNILYPLVDDRHQLDGGSILQTAWLAPSFLPEKQVFADGHLFMRLPRSLGPDSFKVHHTWRDSMGESVKQDLFPD